MPYTIAMLSVHTSPLDRPGRTKDAGGMNVYIRELARALAERNLTIDIYTRLTNAQTPQIVHLSPRVRVIHIQAGPCAPIQKHNLYQHLTAFAHNIDEFRHEHSLHYDLIHSHYWLSGVAALQLARLWNVPHTIMFHTLGRLKQLANPLAPEPPLRLQMEQQLFRQADRIIASTTDERNQILRACAVTPQQLAVIPCGVDLDLFSPQNKQEARTRLDLPADQPIILFVGRLDPFKGPDLLLRAASMMATPPHVVMVGGKLKDDRELQQLRRQAVELGMGERVHFFGARPQQELPWYYSAADVTVVPSYHETFGLAAVESLACATPVVATRAGGLTTVVRHGETGFLVPRNPGFFAERLDSLLRDPALLAQMSAQCRASVLKFSWSAVARQVHDLYEDLIEEPCLVAQ